MNTPENSSATTRTARQDAPALGNSNPVTSNQVSVHPDLENLVKKYKEVKYLNQIKMSTELAHLNTCLDEVHQLRIPIILDSGCGTGESSIALAKAYPNKFIVGFDKSAHRLSRKKPSLPVNLLITQQRCEDVWSSLAEHNLRCDTYLLYPNPWPKKKHIKRRWHAHPIFPTLLHISESITLRTNWRIYALEFSVALATHNLPHKLTPLPPRTNYLSPFERKYLLSDHSIFEVTSQ